MNNRNDMYGCQGRSTPPSRANQPRVMNGSPIMMLEILWARTRPGAGKGIASFRGLRFRHAPNVLARSGYARFVEIIAVECTASTDGSCSTRLLRRRFRRSGRELRDGRLVFISRRADQGVTTLRDND